MLIAHVVFPVSDSDRDAALAILMAEAATVRAMTGCLAFMPFADPTDSRKIGILHEWATAADFSAYTASAGFAEVGRQLRPMMVDRPVSRRFSASLVETVD